MRLPAERRNDRRIALLIGLLALVAFGPFVSRYTAQPASRYALTAALAEHGTVDLAPYRKTLGIDRAVYNGRLRSDKAPGQPVLAVPVYEVGRVLGFESASVLREQRNLGMWWQTLWSAMLPFAALLACMYLAASRIAPRHALAATFALGFGTLMLPHATNLYGHVLAALFGFGAWQAVVESPDRRAFLIAGLLAGSAVAVEYHAVIVATVVFLTALVRYGRAALAMLVGAVPPAALLAAYQWRAFGAPWRTPFAYYRGVLNGTSEGGFSIPGWHGFVDVVAGNRGLLIVSPIVLLACGAALWCARRGGDLGVAGIAATAIVVAYGVLSAGWSGTRFLEEPGPRYMIPALPFLAAPLAAAWPRVRRIAVVASTWGAVLMVGAATTFILVPVGISPVHDYVRRVLHREFAPTIWSIALGPFGILVHVATVALTAAALARACSRERVGEEPVAVHA